MSVSDEWVMRGKRHMGASMKLAPKAFTVSEPWTQQIATFVM